MISKIKDKIQHLDIIKPLKEYQNVLKYFFSYIVFIILIHVAFYVVLDNNRDMPTELMFVDFVVELLLSFFFISGIIKEIKKEHQIESRLESTVLAHKITSVFAQNIDHQMKTPIAAIYNGIEKQKQIVTIIKQLAVKGGKRDIDKIVYGCSDKTNCSNCRVKDICTSVFKNDIVNTIDKIYEDIEHNINVLNQTLDLVKSNKTMQRNDKDIDLYTLIKRIFSSYKMLRKYSFEFEIDECLVDFKLKDMSVVEFTNIISNNIQNSLDAKSTFIAIKAIKYKNNELDFAIIDNGNGISDKDIENIFELNYSTKGENRGFGMYLCKTLLNKVNGDIKILDSSKQGTTIIIELPVFKIEEGECCND